MPCGTSSSRITTTRRRRESCLSLAPIATPTSYRLILVNTRHFIARPMANDDASGVMLTLSLDRAYPIDRHISWGNNMKRSFVVLSMALAAVGTTPVWAQGTAASGAQAMEPTDSIVQMRSEIRAANATYRANVHAIDRRRDQEIAKARSERNKAVEAARSGVGPS
jgi:hypothetical protein